MMNLLKNSLNFCVVLLCIPNSLAMGQHIGDVPGGRERGQRIKVFYSSILILGFNGFFFSFLFLVGPRFGPKSGRA